MLHVQHFTDFYLLSQMQQVSLNCKYTEMKHLMDLKDFLLVVPYEAVVGKLEAKNNIV